jgi:hypothetical protein
LNVTPVPSVPLVGPLMEIVGATLLTVTDCASTSVPPSSSLSVTPIG